MRWDTILAACLFVAGFSTVFIGLGASASLIGGLLRAYSDILSTIAGIAIIIMGAAFPRADADCLCAA